MKDIIQLLEYYEKFSRRTRSKNLMLFGEWLKQQFIPEENFRTQEESVNDAGIEVMVAYLLGGMSGFYDVWIKLTFEDLPLRSLNDFGIFKTVQHAVNPSKKEIVLQSFLEQSSCIEAIKRLINKGVFVERPDTTDRRIKRVSLSDYGKELIPVIDKKMSNLGKLVVGNMTPMDLRALVPPLKQLNEFHTKLYQNLHYDEIKRMYKL